MFRQPVAVPSDFDVKVEISILFIF